uniref:Uncharacterized protein n=1 Tax=viral metagenome TaxID=1070528 RepID=A0A6C0EQQ4_9ZZZZ
MDDFNVSSLHESKNEWGARLVTILTPLIIDGYKSILDEAVKLCKENNETEKYLMTFQNFISRIPKWNPIIIENERKRICEKSGCNYLEDLVTCVHIIQLKVLTSMRVGQKQKKIDITVPKLDQFIHNIYINVARKLYKNVYLFELNIPPLQIQKHNRELEIIVQECILNTLRESIPVESILKAYMDETVEEDVIEEIKEEIIDEPVENSVSENINNNQLQNDRSNRLSFNDIDYVKDDNNNIISIEAPKNIERLETISELRSKERHFEDSDDESEKNNFKLNISDESFDLNSMDLNHIEEPTIDLIPDLLIDDIEILD